MEAIVHVTVTLLRATVYAVILGTAASQFSGSRGIPVAILLALALSAARQISLARRFPEISAEDLFQVSGLDRISTFRIMIFAALAAFQGLLFSLLAVPVFLFATKEEPIRKAVFLAFAFGALNAARNKKVWQRDTLVRKRFRAMSSPSLVGLRGNPTLRPLIEDELARRERVATGLEAA